MGGDFKVVGLQGLGTYPIDHDFSPSFSSLASSLNQSQAFTAPISPICSSPSLPQFEFNEQLPRSAHDSCSPATPPPSVRGSLSSPSSCSHPSSSWFPSLNSEHLKRQQYNNSAICSGRNRPLLLPASLSEANGFVPCDSMPASSDGLIPRSSLSTNASYRYQKTMTATLCKQKLAGHDSTNQQMKSHTISSSWTISSSSSSLSPSPFFKQQENNFLSPSLSPSPSVWRENPAGPSMSPSSSIWRDDTAPSEPDDVASSLMPPRISEDESIYTETLGEDVIAMDYDPLDSSEVKKKSPRRNRNNSAKTGNHLWEFVRDLLRDPKFNPKLLKWEDKENGVFRFVQSEQVARLWGKKKNNPMMTYEKLSRAMRFCRKTGFFNAVPRTGKFPKKLCFMFGDKAHGWRD